MIVIPAIDIIGGKCVRLSKGDYESVKSYSDNPLEMAKVFEGAGLKRLHLVDLDGAKQNNIRNLHVLEEIASKTSLVIDFGGGIKNEESLADAISAGAMYVTLGSISAKDRSLTLRLLEKYKGHLILGADSASGLIRTSGWMEESGLDVTEFIKSYEGLGFSYVISTDITKDGMLSGPSFELYEKILSSSGIPLIASGGVTRKEDIIELSRMGLCAAIVGKAYYEGYLSLEDLKEAEDAC